MTAPNYAALKTALASTTYSGMTDAQIVAALNAASVSQNVDIPISNVLKYFALKGTLPIVTGWAKSPPAVAGNVTAAAQSAAQTFGLIFGPPPLFDALQMSDPTINATLTGMIAELVSAGLLSSQTQTDLVAMSVTTVSQANLWGWPNGVSENDVVAARAMP